MHIPLNAEVEFRCKFEREGEQVEVIVPFDGADPQQLMAKTMLINMINSGIQQTLL